MYYFYVLYSLKDDKLYKGVSSDVGKRFLKHTMGGTTSTRNRRPLVLIYIEEFESKPEALKYERITKSLTGGTELRQRLIGLGLLNDGGKLKLS